MNDILAEEFERGMQAIADRLVSAPLLPAMEDCTRLLQAGFAENFDSAQDSAGLAWPPRKDELPHPLLRLGEALLESAGRPDAFGNVTRIDDRELAVGTDLIYAATHQFGDPSRNIPQREYLFATQDTLDTCGDTLADEALLVFLAE